MRILLTSHVLCVNNNGCEYEVRKSYAPIGGIFFHQPVEPKNMIVALLGR
jgi:hypothetical protein